MLEIFNKKEYQKKYYLKHKKRFLANGKKYRSDPKIKEKLKIQAREYHLKNKDKINAKLRKYRSDPKNRDKLKAQAGEYRLKQKEKEFFEKHLPY